MVKCKALSILSVAVTCLCVVVFICAGDLYDHVFSRQPDPVSIQPHQEMQRHNPSSNRYGKFEMPVHISIDLAQAENTGRPVTIMTAISSDIAVRSGTLTLKIPQIDGDPERTEALWSAAHSGFVAETAEYTLGLLPMGRYQVIAFFEFTSDREGAEKRIVSRSLYLDVRPDTILSSNVSFRHIDRLALRQDLDDRVLMSLDRGSRPTDRERMGRELTLLEANGPTLMPRKIAALRATEPDVASRVMALNRTNSEAINEIGTGETNQAPTLDSEDESVRRHTLPHRGQPAFEQVVPISERLKRQRK